MTPSVLAWIDRHRIASFLAVTYAFTWTIQGIVALSGMSASWTMSILIGFGAFGPPVGAAVVVWAAGGNLRSWVGQFGRWRIGAKWWAAALLIPLAVLVVLAFGTERLSNHEVPDTSVLGFDDGDGSTAGVSGGKSDVGREQQG